MKEKIVKKPLSVAAALVSISLLAGCSSTSSMASNLTTPVGFHKASQSGSLFEYSSLKNGKSEADLKTVCQDLFTWAEDNKFSRYTLIDNTFVLADYDKQGRPISKIEGEDSPFIAACASNMERLTEKGVNASPEGENHNRIIAFFGKFGDGKDILGNAYLTVGFEGKLKYLTLNGEFKKAEPVSK